MRQVLCLTSSPRRDTSYSNLVAARVLKELDSLYPDSAVIIRDLAGHPLPHIDADFVTATRSVAGPRTKRQQALIEQSDILVDELVRSDTIVIAAGMINFGIPSSLKAWIDYVVRPGQTFRYTEHGTKGLLGGRRAILILARGGIYSGGPLKIAEHDESYLRTVLNFLGITDIQSILIEGVGLGPESAERAVDAAIRRASSVARIAATA